MDSKQIKSLLPLVVVVTIFVIVAIWRIHSMMSPPPVDTTAAVLPVLPVKPIPVVVSQAATPIISPTPVGKPQTLLQAPDQVYQHQFDLERQHTRDINNEKNKLQQLNLQLDEEKAISEINKLKKENAGAYNEPTSEGQSNLPEVRIDYIGGDSSHKETIVDMAGTSYRVKDKSNLTDHVQVVSISETSVTLHFSEPVNLTKTFDFKPE